MIIIDVLLYAMAAIGAISVLSWIDRLAKERLEVVECYWHGWRLFRKDTGQLVGWTKDGESGMFPVTVWHYSDSGGWYEKKNDEYRTEEQARAAIMKALPFKVKEVEQ